MTNSFISYQARRLNDFRPAFTVTMAAPASVTPARVLPFLHAEAYRRCTAAIGCKGASISTTGKTSHPQTINAPPEPVRRAKWPVPHPGGEAGGRLELATYMVDRSAWRRAKEKPASEDAGNSVVGFEVCRRRLWQRLPSRERCSSRRQRRVISVVGSSQSGQLQSPEAGGDACRAQAADGSTSADRRGNPTTDDGTRLLGCISSTSHRKMHRFVGGAGEAVLYLA